MIVRLACCVCLAGGTAVAQDLRAALPPGARTVVEIDDAGASLRIPVSAFDASAGTVAAERVTGDVRHRVWQVTSGALTPAQAMAPLRAALEAQGFEPVFACAAQACGGFAFRFETETLPPPEMYVDLGNFEYLALRRSERRSERVPEGLSEQGSVAAADPAVPSGPETGPESAPESAPQSGPASGRVAGQGAPEGTQVPDWATLMVSRSDSIVFVQLSAVETSPPPAVLPVTTGAPASRPVPEPVRDLPPSEEAEALQGALRAEGRAVLEGLSFAPGAGTLTETGDGALQALADFLAGAPGVGVALVGHTDAQGGLAANTELSRQRAEAVRARLIARFGVAPERVRAEGVGYLAPLTTNSSPEGRARNRRVEVVLEDIR